MFGNVQRPVYFNQRSNEVDKTPILVKKPVEKKVRKAFIEIFQKTKSTQITVLEFPERTQLIKMTNFEMEYTKF